MATQWTGSTTAFILAVAVILAWIVTGPIFKFSDTWQLVINTGTTIITFLMVFLIQPGPKRPRQKSTSFFTQVAFTIAHPTWRQMRC